MNNMKQHLERKNTLLSWYDRLADSPVFHSEEMTREQIEKRKGNLLQRRFVVAICGQMNSGKSTIMNALLFQDNILPMSPTTMTAKITLMKGAKDPSIEATLYSADEWPQIVQSINGEERAAREFAEARGHARKEGLREQDLLSLPATVITENSLNHLVKFVGVSEDGGLYTPYVKEVSLTADIPWLHEVTVVDTPGTSDPNPDRDQLTKKWIQEADAVVYVTYAGQAGMDLSDVEFLDDNLLHVPQARRLIAVNKCDSVAGAESAIRAHLSSKDVRMQALLADEDQIVLVSGQAGLISGIEAAGGKLDEECSDAREALAREGWLDGDRHKVGLLRQKIEERIISTAGIGLIGSHKDYLASIFERAERTRDANVGMLGGELSLFSSDHVEREAQRKQINGLIFGMGEEITAYGAKMRKATDAAMCQAQEENYGHLKSAEEGIEKRLTEVKNVGSLAAQCEWILRKIADDSRSKLHENIQRVGNFVEKQLRDLEQLVSEKLRQNGFGERRRRTHFLHLSPFQICRDALRNMSGGISREDLEASVKKATTRWERIWNLKGGRSEAVECLVPDLMRALEAAFDGVEGMVLGRITEACEEAGERLEEEVNELLHSQLRLLESFDEEDKQDDERRLSIEQKLSNLENEIAEVKMLKEEFELSLQ